MNVDGRKPVTWAPERVRSGENRISRDGLSSVVKNPGALFGDSARQSHSKRDEELSRLARLVLLAADENKERLYSLGKY